MFISAAILASALAACDDGSLADSNSAVGEVIAAATAVPNCDDASTQQAIANEVRDAGSRLGERIEVAETNYDDTIKTRSCRMVAHYNDYSDIRVIYDIQTDLATREVFIRTSSIDLVNTAEQNERFAAEAAQHRANAVQSTEAAVTP
jgi:hypothetical protein